MSDESYRVNLRTFLADWPILLLMLLGLFAGLWALPHLPEQVPVHWGLNGQPDRMGPPWQITLPGPLLALAIYFLMLFLPLLDPRRANYQYFTRSYRLLRHAIVLFMLLIHAGMLASALGAPVSPTFVVRVALPLLFLLIGNQLGQTRQTFFVGIRTPWTLASEQVWERTHRAAGRLWVVCGLLQLAAAFLDPRPGFILFMLLTLIMVLVPVLHSYLLFRQDRR